MEKLSISLWERAGVYFIYNKERNLIYIGKSSTNIGERMFESAFEKKDYSYYISYVLTKTRSDARLYEIFYINKYKPIFNLADKEDDCCSMELPELKMSSVFKIYQDSSL
jgi:excinuclease UvrABC nuclease subunit